MAVIINGDTGIDKITDGSVVADDLASTLDLSSKTITLADGTNTISAGTEVASTSGTSIDFTSIPSWVKRITVIFNGMSVSGTSSPLIQLGSGSPTTSGYTSRGSYIAGASANDTTYTAGFGIYGATASNTYTGNLVVTNISGNNWVCSAVIGGSATWFTTGNISLAGVLDRIRITTVNGTDTFDAGSINILYE